MKYQQFKYVNIVPSLCYYFQMLAIFFFWVCVVVVVVLLFKLLCFWLANNIPSLIKTG
jgi:hypothetical protein